MNERCFNLIDILYSCPDFMKTQVTWMIEGYLVQVRKQFNLVKDEILFYKFFLFNTIGLVGLVSCLTIYESSGTGLVVLFSSDEILF